MATQYALLLALTSEGAAPTVGGETVLTRAPGGRSFSKRDWRQLMALIAAEQAAQEKAQESPEAKEALEPAISAAEGVIAAAPLIDDLPDDLGELTRALRTAVSASRLADITRWAAEAAEIGRRAEIEMYARIEAQEDAANEREVEAFALAMIEDDRAALKRAVEKFLKQVKRRK